MSLKEKMTALADAVRKKAELTDTLTIDEMTEAVNGLAVNGVDVDERTLSVTPTKEQQTFTSSDLGENAYYGTVTVEPIPSDYTTTDDATAVSSDILEGKVAYVKGEKVTGTMPDSVLTVDLNNVSLTTGYVKKDLQFKVGTDIMPQTPPDGSEGSAVFTPDMYGKVFGRGIYLNVPLRILGDSHLLPENIKKGVSIFNVEGTYTGSNYPDEKDVRYGVEFGFPENLGNGVTLPRYGTFTGDATVVSSDILEGKVAYSLGEKVVGTIPTVTPSREVNVVTVRSGYIPEEKIITIGTAKEAETFTPGTADITIPADTYLTGAQVIRGDGDLTPENIKTGVSIFDVEGNFTADANALASDILKGKTAYIKGKKVTGTAAIGEEFYKCTAVFGPKKVTFLTVSGAGTEECNGRYAEDGTKNGATLYKRTSSSGVTWYIYYISSEWDENGWVLSDNKDVSYMYGGHYFANSVSEQWYMGDAGASEPAPTVAEGSEVINSGQPKTWNGRKVMLNDDGAYSFDENVTKGLSYGSAFTPAVGFIYNPSCTILINRLRAQASCTAIKFQINKVRSSGNGVQMSEFILVDYAGNEIDWSSLPVSSVIADSDNNSPSEQEPEKLIDGDIDTKWFSWQFNEPSFVQINFNSATSFNDIAGYRWYTADDSLGRDPVTWQVLLLNPQGEWEVVSEVADHPVTSSRGTLVGTWDFNF